MVNQKGFAPIVIIILIAAGLVGGYLVYTNYSNNRTKMSPQLTAQPTTQSQSKAIANPTLATVDEPSNWEIYTDNDYSLKHPSDWTDGILKDKNCGGIDFYLRDLISTSFSICKPYTDSDDTPDNLARISLGSNKLLSRVNISVDGHKGIVQEIQLINGNYQLTVYIGDVLTKITLEGGRIENKSGTIVITFTDSDQLRFQNTKAVVNQILPTFIFLNQGKTSDTAKWKIYKNQKYGFEIKYPLYWYVKEHGDFSLLFGKGYEPKDIPPLTHPWGDLSIEVNKIPFTDKELNKVGIEQGAELEGEGILNKRQYRPATFLGYPANKKIQLTTALIDGNLGTVIIFNAKGYGWTVHFPATDYEGHNDPIYDQILSTFKFLDQ